MRPFQQAVPRTKIDAFGTLGAFLGVLATSYILFFWKVTVHTRTGAVVATADGGVRERTASSTETVYEGVLSMFLADAPSDPALLVWPVLVAVVAVTGGAATWKRHRAGVWASVLALAAIAILGLFTFGLLVVPSAAAMLLAALLVQSERRGGSEPASDAGRPSSSGGRSWALLVRRDVLGLFLFLAGPIAVLQVLDVQSAILTLLALPGYLALALFGLPLAVTGLENVLGTTAIYALNVVWTYLLSLALVVGVRAAVDRLSD